MRAVIVFVLIVIPHLSDGSPFLDTIKEIGSTLITATVGAAKKFFQNSWDRSFSGNKTIEPETYSLEIRKFLNEDLSKKLNNIKLKFSKEVKSYNTKLENTQLNKLPETLQVSGQLSGLTTLTLATIKSIETALTDLESILGNTNFFIRQEYNIARYKLDASIRAGTWGFYAKTK